METKRMRLRHQFPAKKQNCYKIDIVRLKDMENDPILFITYGAWQEPFQMQGTEFASAHKTPDILADLRSYISRGHAMMGRTTGVL